LKIENRLLCQIKRKLWWFCCGTTKVVITDIKDELFLSFVDKSGDVITQFPSVNFDGIMRGVWVPRCVDGSLEALESMNRRIKILRYLEEEEIPHYEPFVCTKDNLECAKLACF